MFLSKNRIRFAEHFHAEVAAFGDSQSREGPQQYAPSTVMIRTNSNTFPFVTNPNIHETPIKQEPRIVDYSDSDNDSDDDDMEEVVIKREVRDGESGSNDEGDDGGDLVAGTVIKREVLRDAGDDEPRVKMEGGQEGGGSDGLSIGADGSGGEDGSVEETGIKAEVVVPPTHHNDDGNNNNSASASVVGGPRNVAPVSIKRELKHTNAHSDRNHNADDADEAEEEEEAELSVVRATISAFEREFRKNATIILALNQISTESASLTTTYAKLSLLQSECQTWATELDAKFRSAMAKLTRDEYTGPMWDAFVKTERPAWAELIAFAMETVKGKPKNWAKARLPLQQAIAHAVFVCEERNKRLVAEVRKQDPEVAHMMLATEVVKAVPRAGGNCNSRNSRNGRGGGGGGPIRARQEVYQWYSRHAASLPTINWGSPPYWPELRVGGTNAVWGDEVRPKRVRKPRNRGKRNTAGAPITDIKIEVKEEYPQQQHSHQPQDPLKIEVKEEYP
ncbi:hypothetical protein HDU87_006157 [Geranomyces variabilis]|uniref:Uncharacterized protein n=1 Tax=Geranomyces variabilis TaxID=109894 RepID=A0AAD5TID1_9FUNG|nr:hypothetical protein HDU87_006157 [Geranomyces variabilis]